MRAACKDCAFAKLLWREGDDYQYSVGCIELATGKRTQTNYECRRYAPRGMVAIPNDAFGVENFATMLADDWCGEFSPRGEA